MKFAKHLAKAMRLSDPEWLPFWLNYRFLKKILPSKGSLMSPAAPAAPPTVVVDSEFQYKLQQQRALLLPLRDRLPLLATLLPSCTPTAKVVNGNK